MSGVTPYDPPPIVRSNVLKELPTAIPSNAELEVLIAELKYTKQKAAERAKKATEDLRSIEESLRRLKEKEKGKGKAVDKPRRERGFTPLPNAASDRLSVQPASLLKSRLPTGVVSSTPSRLQSPTIDPRKAAADEARRKKKKRKREDYSDEEPEPVKQRKTTPIPPHPPPHVPAPKASKFPSSLNHSLKPSAGQDFSVPPPVDLLPKRPPVHQPPIPGPSKPSEVKEDFSKAKQPSQVLVTTFYTSIEPWLRPIKEEDIGFLEYTHDEVEPFVMPKLGRHYSEVWEEEDLNQYGTPLPGTAAVRSGVTLPGSASTAPLPKWEPSTLTEADCLTEERGHGPLTERLVSSMIPLQNTEWKGVKAAEEAMEGRPGTNGAAAQAARDKMNVHDLEERVKNVMRHHRLLDEIPDFSEAVDDPIATALRHAQRELRTVLATNKARRARLVAIARDRLSYQEFLDTRDILDRGITNLYAKLQKKENPKSHKKKKKPEPNTAANGANPSGVPLPSPAALGLVQTDDHHLSVPEQLKQLVETRRKFVEWCQPQFEKMQEQMPGRIWGLPQSSVYDGVEEEVRQELARVTNPRVNQPSPNGITSTRTSNGGGGGGKGKARARVEDVAMELG